jgi:acyl-homoserine-lactone acylase
VVADIEAGKIVPDQSLAFNSPHPEFVTPWQANNPLTTPIGLNTVNQTQLVTDLDAAYNTVAATFANQGGASVPWGDAHKTTLVTRTGATQQLVFPFAANAPLSGTDDPFGPLRVVNPVYISELNEFISYGGDGYVQVIEFTPTGSVGGTLLTYGNASRPNSPHITDQLPFFESKTLKPALRTYSAVQAATVYTESY